MAITASKLEIINFALVSVGASPIATLSQGDGRAVTANAKYEIVKRKHLSSHPWRFALKKEKLPSLATVPVPHDEYYSYAYQKPPNSLEIGGFEPYGIFELYDTTIVTDVDPANANLVYIDLVDEPAFSTAFAHALGVELAKEIVVPITENSSRLREFVPLAQAAWQDARFNDAKSSFNKGLAEVFQLAREQYPSHRP